MGETVGSRHPLGVCRSETIAGSQPVRWAGKRVVLTRHVLRCRANMEQVRQSKPDSGLGFNSKSLKPLKLFSLRSKTAKRTPLLCVDPGCFLTPNETFETQSSGPTDLRRRIQSTYCVSSNCCYRFRAKREQLEIFEGLLPERRGPNLALTVLYVPDSLDSGQQFLVQY